MKLPYMNKEIGKIIKLLKNAHSGNCWTGDNYDTILRQISPQLINTSVKGFNNTIHQLVYHLLATDKLIINRIDRNQIELKDDENWPSAKKLESISWEETLQLKNEVLNQLINKLETLDDNRLDESPYQGYSTYYVQLHGLIEHLHYHMGQIRLIHNYLINSR